MPGAVAGDITQNPYPSDKPILYQSWMTGSGDDRGFLAVNQHGVVSWASG